MKEYLAVYIVAMLKFLFAFPAGAGSNLNFIQTLCLSIAGMMSTVLIITLFKSSIKRLIYKLYFNKKKKFSKTNRRIVNIYQKFGLAGIALATPPLLTPIGGTLIAVTRGESASKILLYMLASSIIWGLTWGAFVFFLKDTIYHLLGWQ
jgi:uncharacterized membrane protein